jgi:hypothetical protein
MAGFMLKPAVETYGIKHPLEEGSVIVQAVKQAVSFPLKLLIAQGKTVYLNHQKFPNLKLITCVQISPCTGQNLQCCLILAFENIENIIWYDTVFGTYKLTFLEITLIIIKINGPSLPPANSAQMGISILSGQRSTRSTRL